MRGAAYVRVSTTRQAQQQTIAQQVDRITTSVQAQGGVLPTDQIERDDGFSGAVRARPGLDHLRDAVARRELDRVLITAPDRLARNDVPQMVLLAEFGRYGWQVDFRDRPMSDDPHDQLLLQIRGAVARRLTFTEPRRSERGDASAFLWTVSAGTVGRAVHTSARRTAPQMRKEPDKWQTNRCFSMWRRIAASMTPGQMKTSSSNCIVTR